MKIPVLNPCSYIVLIEHLLNITGCKTPLHLSRYLGIQHSVVYSLLGGKSHISAGSILRIHETTGMAVSRIRELCNRPFEG